MNTTTHPNRAVATPASRGDRSALAWSLALFLGTLFPPPSTALEGPGLLLHGQVGSGGGTSVGGTYALEGAVLVPTGAVSSGGGYTLTGGVGPGESRASSQVKLQAVITPAKDAQLTWEAGATGYVLEFSPTLGPDAHWQPVVPQPTGNSFLSPCAQPARFFRLRQTGP